MDTIPSTQYQKLEHTCTVHVCVYMYTHMYVDAVHVQYISQPGGIDYCSVQPKHYTYLAHTWYMYMVSMVSYREGTGGFTSLPPRL